MNFFEDLGSGLGSLSLHDQQKWVEADVDDPMEIDNSETETQFHQDDSHWNQHDLEMDEDSKGPTVEVIEADDQNYDVSLSNKKDRDDDEDDEHDSFLGILSPTALGARFALQPQKLLMAPPTKPAQTPQRKLSIDYEFDTSDMQNSQLIQRNFVPQKHVSSFAKSNRDVFQSEPFNNTNGLGPKVFTSNSIFDSHLSQPSPLQNFKNESYSSGMFANSIFNSSRFGYNAHSQPQTVVHHHHYYSEPQLNRHSPLKTNLTHIDHLSTETLSTDLQDLSFQPDTQLMKTEQYEVGNSQSKNLLVGFKSSENQSVSLQLTSGNHGPYLPSPWDPRAVPAERLPYVFLSYLQLLTNTLLSAYALHILVAMVQAIRNDVSLKMTLEANSLLVEIALCRRAYKENNCDPNERVPALETMCQNWEKCMSQDPDSIGNRSLIGAHTVGMILNSLIEPLGLKVLSVFAFFIVVIFACNFAFGYFRARAYYGMSNETQEKLSQ